ncbi:AMP-binding protein [Modestobacter sp. Leaf380]|uniref:AMP-binding protein n=1 Tax=Modestobacter sp. Leaf380 TaxID=1736356 RepID=UPI000B1F26C9|nr:AMP-binding protein [Modestobacter sp. Leaf380]
MTLLVDGLLDALRDRPGAPALLGRRPTTRGELADLADGYAAALHHRGLGEGDTLALAVRPGGRALALVLAALRLRVRVAVVDPGAGPDVVTARLALARPALVVADPVVQAAAGWAAPVARRLGLSLPRLELLAPVATVGRRLPGTAPALEPRSGPAPDRRGDDADAVVVFTSGTTAAPRAVVHTVASMSAGMAAVADLVGPRPGEPVLGGTFFVLVPALHAGAPVLAPARRPPALARQLARLAPAATYLTPPQLRGALAAGAGFTGRVFAGSAPVSEGLLGRVRDAGADQAWGVYALTEAFPVAAVEWTAKHAHTGDGDLVGELLPGVRARVDGTGQLLVAGATTADRYLGGEPLEEVATGDRARLEGRTVVLAGRAKDMLLRGAENVYPGLYEPALHVPGVDLAVLVGVPGEDGDERVVAVVQPTPGSTEVQVRRALATPLSRMGTARPDAVLVGPVPVAGRSRKPDRAATARWAAERLARR